MKNKKVFAFFFLFFLLPAFSSWAYWVWSPETGKFVNPEGVVQDTADEQYDYAMQFYREKNFKEAADQLQNLLKKFPGAKIAAEAQYRLGTIHEETGDFLRAFHAYKVLIESYPQSERLNEAVEREYRIGNLFLSGKKGKFMGLEILPSLPRAAEVFEHIVKNAPYSAFGDQAQFRLGVTYKKWAHYDEAVEAFQALIDQYPKSELVPEARYQLAETSFARSAASGRDQRALDEAMGKIDQFLARHTDSNLTSEKAAKLRQAIDEKNAEKNYRIGLYYEKENYVSSALIYYNDVAARYPHTRWGQKAITKAKSLKAPAEYLNTQEKLLQEQIRSLDVKLHHVGKEDEFERDQVKRQLERLKQQQKGLEKNKSESLKRRGEDIKRRERELKEKFKKLQNKRKLAKNNPSEDFQRAMDRWTASLEAEREELQKEKQQIKEWGREMGVQEHRMPFAFPFTGETPSELDRIRQVEAKKLFKVADEKKSILEEKEILYKQRGEVSALLGDMESGTLGLVDEDKALEEILQLGGEEFKSRREKLKATRDEIKRLETALDEKKSFYEKHFGAPSWLGRINPFDGDAKTFEGKDQQELLERRMHVKERIAVQHDLTETLSRAFDAELALQEQKRLLATIESEEKIDPRELRKQIKRFEKEIRAGYEDITARHKHKNELLGQLENLLREEKKKGFGGVMRTVASPAVGAYRFSHAFLFGLPHKEVELTKEAKTLRSGDASVETAQALRDEIELESLMIEAKSRELMQLQKERDILKAKASLSGGYKFRSAIVKVPYLFIGEAIQSAHRLVPEKDRQELIINRLDQETRELERLKQELKELEAAIDKKSGSAPAKLAETPAPQESVVRSEIQSLTNELEIRENVYRNEKGLFEAELQAIGREVKGKGKQKKVLTEKQGNLVEKQNKLRKELRDLEKQLTQLIEKESELELEESTILEKRIRKIDTVMKKISSRAASQDLLTERERMEDRMAQLESRRDFLTKERERFEIFEGLAAQ